MRNISGLFLAGCSALALAGCGPSDIASPGTGGNVNINVSTPAPTPTPTSGSGGTVTAASGCPTIADPQGLTDGGTITGPTGTWRVCHLPRTFKVSSSLPKIAGLLYSMNGRVDVGCDGGFAPPSSGSPFTSTTVGCTTPLTSDTNVTLTIAPGVILFGNTGQSWLAVNRGNKISAVGSSTQPIIFTSRDNVLGLNTDDSQGQWGGVVLLGRSKVTDCNVGTVSGNTCERDTEGATDLARFGGNNTADNSGRMSFVQIRYSGFVLSAGKELQSLTTEAIGSGTVLDHIMSYNSSDDGAEFFGGNVNLSHYIAVGADDDSMDVDTGAQMNVQYALLLPKPGKGDALFEIDSNGAETDTPRTVLNVTNFTAIQSQTSADNEANDQAASLFRGNSDIHLSNGIIVAPNNECIRLNGSGTTPVTFTARSVVMQCNSTKYIGSGSLNASAVQTAFGSGSNNNNDGFTPSLTSLFINGSNETGIAAFNATGVSSFFASKTYIGAVQNSSDTWYAGWTCNSSTANFGSGNSGLCTSLPTT
ncbi:MAG: hypothetical protein AB7F98_06765 [Novosphingobium sp.]